MNDNSASRNSESDDQVDPEMDLVYTTLRGLDDVDRFEIAPKDVMEYAAQVINVATSCTTWGEVREMATSEIYQEFLDRAGYGGIDGYLNHVGEGKAIRGHEAMAMDKYFHMDFDSLPPDDAEFLIEDVDGYMVGDFPPMSGYAQTMCLPADVLDEYGERYETTLNGTFTDIPAHNAEAVLATLRSRGYRCEENRGLFVTEMFRFEDLPKKSGF